MFGNHRTRLTHEGWYFLIVLAFIVVAGSMRQINLMLIMAGMMVGAIYFNWHLARAMLRRLQIRRRLPDQIGAGDTLVVELEVASPHRCTALVITDAIRRLGSAARSEDMPRGSTANSETDVRGIVALPHVAPGRAARGEYRVTFEERGRYEFGPLWAMSRHPFGLVARSVRLRRSSRLLVLPRLGRLTNRWTHLAQSVDYGSQQASGRQRPTDGEFYGLRDWQPGDSRRLIHWRTSARRGGLMVRQFEQPRSENLTLLVELWQSERPTSADRERVELAIRFAATATVEACRRGGSQLRVVTAGREQVSHRGGASKSLARDILAHLAVAEASSNDRLEELIGAAADSRRTAGQLVLVTTHPALPDPSALESPDRRVRARVVTLVAGSEEFFQYFQAE
jgi:uncharacterized protein (DUF58 family)